MWVPGPETQTQLGLFPGRQEFALFLSARPCKHQLGALFTFFAGAVLVAQPSFGQPGQPQAPGPARAMLQPGEGLGGGVRPPGVNWDCHQL